MKPLRYAFITFAIATCVVTSAFAGGEHCQKSASGAAAAQGCCKSTKGTSATSAAVVAADKRGGCPASGQCPMSAAQCQAMAASGACSAEMRAQCAKGASATAAGAAGQCSRNASMAHITCDMHGANAASGCCGANGTAGVTACDVCSDEAQCDGEVHATGARSQLVSLRNGVMFVYTADGAASVRALQAAVARHNARVLAVLSGQSSGTLCRDCKQLRGAMASGKFVREVVNVERGCQVLLTSSDHALVDRIHAMASPQIAMRVRD